MEFNVGKVGINLGGWYGIFLGDKGSLSVYKCNTLIKFAPMHQEAPCHITHDESRLIAFCPEMPRNSSPNHFVPLSTFTCTFFNEYVRLRLWL